MNALSRFGFLLLTGSAIAIILLKIFTHFSLFTGSVIMTDLTAFSILFSVFVALAVIFIFNGVLKNIIMILIVFVLVLVLMYFIAPIYLVGV